MLNFSPPVIGLTLDSEYTGGYSERPWYAIRQNYCDWIVSGKGIPFPLTHHCDLVPEYAARMDGLVITGGGFDIDPALYRASNRHPSVKTKPERTQFEMALAETMYRLGKPILGICGGMQLINVLFGGTLIQHIPEAFPEALSHQHPHPEETPHAIDIVPHTCLDFLSRVGIDQGMEQRGGKKEKFFVNTAHHQAVGLLGLSLRISAKAEDGIIECIEGTHAEKFVMGIQWHPEYQLTTLDQAILRYFIYLASKVSSSS